MAPPSKSASNSEAGPSSKPSTASFGPSYAEALRSSPFFGSKFQYRMGHQNRYASFRVGRPGEPQPAAHAVFNTPELLAMILAKLPMADARRVMAVSKLFRACLNPYAEYHLLGIKEALGLRFSRSIESLSASEKKQLQGQSCQHTKGQGPFAKWLFNISLDCKCLRRRYTPILEISPFTLAGLTHDETSGVLEISLKLVPENIEQDVSARERGVAKYRNNSKFMYYYRVSAHHNWKDVKLVNMPFKVQVSVSVDFRKAMGAPSHTEGPCPVYGCHVGLCGVQHTKRLFDPENATVGAFFSFLDIVEHETRCIHEHVAKRTVSQYPGIFREPYYLGPPSEAPPMLSSEYKQDYVLGATSHPDDESRKAMTPRRWREIAYTL